MEATKLDKRYAALSEIEDNLYAGGCGDIEEAICKKDKDNYCAKNCKACQKEYLTILKKYREPEDAFDKAISKMSFGAIYKSTRRSSKAALKGISNKEARKAIKQSFDGLLKEIEQERDRSFSAITPTLLQKTRL